MGSTMKNYRKARKGDIKCKECCHSHKPSFPGTRIRCAPGYPAHVSYAVGQNMTCDGAALE